MSHIFNFGEEEPSPEALEAWKKFEEEASKNVFYSYSDLEKGLFLAGYRIGKESNEDHK